MFCCNVWSYEGNTRWNIIVYDNFKWYNFDRKKSKEFKIIFMEWSIAFEGKGLSINISRSKTKYIESEFEDRQKVDGTRREKQ